MIKDRENFKKKLGQYIRINRQQKNLTIEQLAERAEIDAKHLNTLELGRKLPNSFTLTKILIALEISYDLFIQDLERNNC